MMSEEEFRWAEALAIEKRYGSDAARYIAERLEALNRAGDAAGVERFTQIAARFEQLTARENGRA